MDTDVFFKCLAKESRDRGAGDIDIITDRLKSLLAFQKYRSHHLSHFASVMAQENLAPEQILFNQGDEGNDWYVIFQGAVDISVGGQVVCSFGAGIGFGDVAIMENTARTATVIGKESCVLLKVPGSVFKTIAKEVENEANSGPLDDLSEAAEAADIVESESSEAVAEEAEKTEDDSSVFNFGRRGSVDTLKDLKIVLDLKPEERGPDDILDLLDEISHIKAFSHLSSSVLRELCNCIVAQYNEPGDVLFKQGDIGTCWYVIYKGKVEVIVNGVAVCTLSDGDGFGELALINDKPRSATIRVAEQCQFIKVEKADYNRILKDIESNTIRLEEHGKEVVVLEKRTDPSTRAAGYIVMSGTPERLARQLEENNEADPTFAVDFLMSFRIFTTPHDVLRILQTRMQTTADDGADEKTKAARQRKLASVLKFWVANHTADFVQDATLVTALLEVTDILQKDGVDADRSKILSAMEQKKLDTGGRKSGAAPEANAQAAALASEEPGKITLRKKNSAPTIIRPFRFSFRSNKDTLEAPVSEPSSPASATGGKEHVRVFMLDETFKTIDIEPLTTAKEALEAAVGKFAKPGEPPLVADEHEFCELKSEGTVRVMEPDELSLLSKVSLNGRLFIRKKGSDSKVAVPPELGLPESLFLEMETSEFARIITLHDHALFCRIDPLEFINHIYKIKGKDTTNINNFVNQFNRMNYWVVTEICSQPNLQKRVLQIKKFIKLASLFKALNNYNSLFAVLSGLSNVAVSRMQQTWRKVPGKLITEYDALSKLMDPSRNMKTYRTHLLNATPPLVPFFPIVVKDLFFIHECNPSKTPAGLVNFDKLRLLTSIIRFIDNFRAVPYDPNIQPSHDQKKRRSTLDLLNENHLEKAHEANQIREFIVNLQVIDNMRTLSKLSREAESPVGRSKRSASIPRIIMGL